jgi:DNA-binding transcriptional LysR family regulator
MRAVSDVTGIATSAVSQQIATLEREAGVALIERDGRNVRLTPAGRRLVGHARTILGALEAARADLSGEGEPEGTVRIAAFSTAMSRVLVPLASELMGSFPALRLELHECEPDEVVRLLRRDEIDLGILYDYDLAPRTLSRFATVEQLWRRGWWLALPDDPEQVAAYREGGLGSLRDACWIGNSRGPDDERVMRAICAPAGFVPEIGQRVDSLDLVQDMVAAGLGVALLPTDLALKPGVRRVPLESVAVEQRAYLVAAAGRLSWPAAALVADHLRRSTL